MRSRGKHLIERAQTQAQTQNERWQKPQRNEESLSGVRSVWQESGKEEMVEYQVGNEEDETEDEEEEGGGGGGGEGG
eukprot:3056117-Pyramimonas_sp.AAC.3